MISATGKKGLTLIEILVIVVIVSILIGFSIFFPHKAINRINFDNVCKTICEMLDTARNYAITERKSFFVVFDKNSCGIYDSKKNPVGKIYKFPQFIIIEEKTAGFSPVEFLPEGSARQAGHIILKDISTEKTKKIILYNLTGKSAIEKNK